MYIYIYTFIYTIIQIYIYIHIHTIIQMYIYIHVYIFIIEYCIYTTISMYINVKSSMTQIIHGSRPKYLISTDPAHHPTSQPASSWGSSNIKGDWPTIIGAFLEYVKHVKNHAINLSKQFCGTMASCENIHDPRRPNHPMLLENLTSPMALL